MKHVVHIIESASGGSLKYVSDICNQLTGPKWQFTVVYSKRADSPSDLSEMFPHETRFREIPMSRDVNLIQDGKSLFHLLRVTRELDPVPNVVHLHSSKAGVIGRLATTMLGLKAIYTPHGFSFFRKDISTIKRQLYQGIEKVVGCISPAIILVGSMEEHRAACRLVGENKVKLVKNAVQVPDNPYPINTDSRLVVTVGRITYAKNPRLILDTAEMVTKADPSISFVWVGDGELRGYLEEEAKKKGIRIHVTGWIKEEEVQTWIRRARVYLQPSLWEGLPLSLLTAMAMARPVLVSDIQPLRDVITDGVHGYIASSLDQFVRGIHDLMAHPEKCSQMGLSSWNLVQREYSVNSFMQGLESVYLECCRMGHNKTTGD